MRKKEDVFPLFFIFLFLGLIVFTLSTTNIFVGIRSILERITLPLQSSTTSFFKGLTKTVSRSELESIKEENKMLLKQLVDKQSLEKEINALKDQFKTTYPRSMNLLPARIIGSPGFMPGVSQPENLILDKGSENSVKLGQTVVFEDNLVGKINQVSPHLSVVNIITDKSFSVTAKTSQTSALGIVKGQGSGEMILDNVLLSENLKTADLILTKGDIDTNGIGSPPDLIIGKIMSIDKKPSNLFQKASIQSLLDFKKLETVFIVVGNE